MDWWMIPVRIWTVAIPYLAWVFRPLEKEKNDAFLRGYKAGLYQATLDTHRETFGTHVFGSRGD